jgi:hypothetical protein
MLIRAVLTTQTAESGPDYAPISGDGARLPNGCAGVRFYGRTQPPEGDFATRCEPMLWQVVQQFAYGV